jgi:hypothetical protein
MNVKSRLDTLAKLAEQHELDRHDQNGSAEDDLANYLMVPTRSADGLR